MKRRSHEVQLWVALAFTILALAPGLARGQEAPDADDVALLLEGGSSDDFVPGVVVVKLRTARGETPDASMVETERIQSGLDDEPMTTSGGELVFRLDAGRAAIMSAEDMRTETLAAIEAMRANPEVEYAEPNYLMRIVADPNDLRYADQWHYRENGSGANQAPGGIGLPTVWDTDVGQASVVVAVIDTGILPNHPDIAGSPNLLPGFDMISFFGAPGTPDIANDGDGRDADPTDPGDAVGIGECGSFPPFPPQPLPDSWHGTHVAGTVGVGRTNNSVGVAGVNWNVGVVPVRVLGKCGGTSTDIADGIRWAAGLPVPGVPANANPARVINLSLGGSGTCASSQVQQNAISDALAAGVTVVAAAGNDAQDAAGFRPASCNGVITVAASERRGHLASRYSNFGATVEIMAPGGDVRRDDDADGNPDGVLSMVDPSAGAYAYYNGTSMAAPHVAGVAALMLSVNSGLSSNQILAALQSTARARSNAECPEPCGAGLMNAQAAVDAVRSPGGVPPPTLSLNPANSTVRTGDTATLTANTLPGVTVSFSSSDVAIATVTPTAVTDGSGMATTTVTGVATGSATITAQSGSMTAAANVDVVDGTPATSFWALVALAIVAGWLIFRRWGQAGA